ncbi:hypothetical protein H9L39_19972 [Fusarium oxysporum f. sp. albedinis]|nr:hypothetical protein H9L39_19972 [Fusarium oxysporum f. sp. albedinis]
MSFENLLHLFDFNVLTSEQKAWILAHVPPSPSVPALITNALCSSSMLERSELEKFQLDNPGIKWKKTYDSSVDRLATFHDAIATNLEMFHRTIMVFQPHERLSLAIYIPKRIQRSQDCQIDNKSPDTHRKSEPITSYRCRDLRHQQSRRCINAES